MNNRVKLVGSNKILFVSKKIALVGNSNSLLNKDYSNEINKFDTVIRFNLSQLKSSCTGHKTTIRWIRCPINKTSVRQHTNKVLSNCDFIKYTYNLTNNVRILCSSSVEKKLKSINPNMKIYLISSNFNDWNILNKYIQSLKINKKFKVINNCWPRTGFLAILTCLKSGCTPYIYGFDLDQKDYIKHYDSSYVYNVQNITYHQIKTEIDILNEMKKKGLIVVRN